MTSQRRSVRGDRPATECGDGTICENSSPCVPHPRREGSYMCDCAAAKGSSFSAVSFAGVYCEHAATSYCRWSSDFARRSFCTNGGECSKDGGDGAHAGCDCPEGYEGDYCQFVEGSVPDGWTAESFMHPQLIRSHSSRPRDDGAGEANAVVVDVLVLGSVLGLFALVHVCLYCCFCCSVAFDDGDVDELDPDRGVLKEALEEKARRDGEGRGERPGEGGAADATEEDLVGMPGRLSGAGDVEIV